MGGMRQSAEWMTTADERILEVCASEGNMTPKAVSREGRIPRVDVTRKYAGTRMRELAKYGLLCRIDDGVYGIAEEGEQYLSMELDASTLGPKDFEDTFVDRE